MPKLKVIFDTDPGVDDAMALMLLARHPDVDLLGVTTVFGNASIDDVTRNALYLRERFGFDAPVARGADQPIAGVNTSPAPHMIHGHNGLGDIALPAAISGEVDGRPAHQFIVETLRRYPHDVTIIAVGRMTNLALALQHAPDVAGLAHDVVVMGGAFGRNGHTGNVSPVAEANIFGDPEAADLVFGADWPVTIAGLDVTQETVMTDEFVGQLAHVSGEDGRFIREISAMYQKFHKDSIGLDGFYVHDSSAVAYALRPDLFEIEQGPVRVVTDGIAKGQTILRPAGRKFPPGAWDDRQDQSICIGVDSAALLDFYRQTLVST